MGDAGQSIAHLGVSYTTPLAYSLLFYSGPSAFVSVAIRFVF